MLTIYVDYTKSHITRSLKCDTTSFVSFGKFLCCIIISINLFACSSRDKPAPVVTVYGSTPLNKSVKNRINANEYIVRSGETLYSIAWRANSDVRQIAKLNGISPPYNIYSGQKLFLVSKNKEKVLKLAVASIQAKSRLKALLRPALKW